MTSTWGCTRGRCGCFQLAKIDRAIAKRTAEHFGTRHHEMRLTASLGREMFDKILDLGKSQGADVRVMLLPAHPDFEKIAFNRRALSMRSMSRLG